MLPAGPHEGQAPTDCQLSVRGVCGVTGLPCFPHSQPGLALRHFLKGVALSAFLLSWPRPGKAYILC